MAFRRREELGTTQQLKQQVVRKSKPKSRPTVTSRRDEAKPPAVPTTLAPSVPQPFQRRQELTAEQFNAAFPQLNPDVINTLAGQGAIFELNPALRFGGQRVGGQFDPATRRLSLLPGQPIGSAAHEVVHAVVGLAPHVINEGLLSRRQRRTLTRVRRAVQAFPAPGQGFNLQNITNLALHGLDIRGTLTGPGEQIAHSVAGTTPADPFPIRAFANIFNRGVIPLHLLPNIQAGFRR